MKVQNNRTLHTSSILPQLSLGTHDFSYSQIGILTNRKVLPDRHSTEIGNVTQFHVRTNDLS